MPHLVVVGTDKGGIFPRTGLALENNNRDTFVVSTVNGGRDGLHLIGCNNQQVDTLIHKTVNLLHLTLVAIVSGGKLQCHTVVEVGAHLQFRILLVAPDVM